MSEVKAKLNESFVRRIVEVVKKGKGEYYDLRKGSRLDLYECPDAYSVISPFVSHKGKEFVEEPCYTVAVLMAMYYSPRDSPKVYGKTKNLGESMNLLLKRKKYSKEALSSRFGRLVNSNKDDLYYVLRDVIGLLKSSNIEINWLQLFDDIRYWSSENRKVQRDWSISFWS